MCAYCAYLPAFLHELRVNRSENAFAFLQSKIEGIGSTASIIGEAIPVCNSVIYVIDTVLLPFNEPEEFLGVSASLPEKRPSKNSKNSKKNKCDPDGDLTLALSENPDFSILVS